MGLSASRAPNRVSRLFSRLPALSVLAILCFTVPSSHAARPAPPKQRSSQPSPISNTATSDTAAFNTASPNAVDINNSALNGAAVAAYSLPPDKLEKAVHLAKAENYLHFANSIWGILFLLIWLVFGGNAGLRDWAASLTPNNTLMGLIYLPLLILIVLLVSLPFDIGSHRLQLKYGLSVEGWGSWLGDWAKSAGLTLVVGTLALLALYWVIRRSPRRWWIYYWLACLPFIVLVVFVIPVVIDPLFNDFEPLAQSNQPLVDQLERVVARTGTDIPAERMFLMKASEKVTTLNAYVTGLGSTKRVVVWDTTIAKVPTDDILFIFGHESGHYVLNHIYEGMAFSAVVLLLFLWICYQLTYRILQIYGPGWKVPNLQDWSSAAVLILLFSILSFLSEPIDNSFSRMVEHEADIYGQEAIHSIVADPQRVARQSFQRLGELSLDDPNPSPFIVFWTYSHPSIADRYEFAGSYNPWAPGQQPKYFKKD